MALPLFDQEAFQAGERAVLDANEVAEPEVGPGLGGESRLDDGLDGGDLGVIHRDRVAANADDTDHAGGGQDRDAPIAGIEAAEDVAGEEGQVEMHDAV